MSTDKTKSNETAETQNMEAQSVKKTDKVKKEAVRATDSRDNIMYLGPTIMGILRHSTVFKNGVFPKKVEECVTEFPIMKKLFVTMEELPKAVNELKKEQSVLSTVYRQTENKFK